MENGWVFAAIAALVAAVAGVSFLRGRKAERGTVLAHSARIRRVLKTFYQTRLRKKYAEIDKAADAKHEKNDRAREQAEGVSAVEMAKRYRENGRAYPAAARDDSDD